MRPRHDVTTPLEPEAAETIHFLRNSNDQWQATAERVARQRDEALSRLDQIKASLLDNDRPEFAQLNDIMNIAFGFDD